MTSVLRKANKTKPKHLRTGEVGEQIAERFLVQSGWRVLKKNWRKKFGEIDVVARDSEGVLVCVEVKTMRVSGGGAKLVPEDQMTYAKTKKLRRAAQAFVNQYKSLWSEKKGWRIDVLSITLPPGVDDKNVLWEQAKIEHYENI